MAEASELAQPVVPLAEVRDDDVARVGAKAAHLARMLREELPVPAGFCVTGRAYRQHIRADESSRRIRHALGRLPGDSPGERGTILPEIRDAIRAAPLAARVREEIERHWRALAAPSVAVRSSATAEDLPGHSFAGQYDTFLAVGDLPTCLQRVKDCWASLWSDRAFEYRAARGIDHLAVEMAVVVQELVPAEAAGVAFTADPVSGRRDCVVIEGSLGLGEAVVGGKVTPDRIVVSRRAFLVERRTTARKAVEIVLAAAGGIRERPVGPARAERPCLDDVTACRLARLAVRAESLFAAPQDVEWAVADGQAVLLQARPITALPPAPQRSWADRQIWTNANFREAAPDVMTPMTLSLVLPFLEPMFGPLWRKMGITITPKDLADLVAGRIYFNVNTLAAILRALPNLRAGSMGRLFGGQEQGVDEPVEIVLPDEDLPAIRVPWYRRALRVPDFLLWWLRHPMRLAPRVLARAESRIGAIRQQPWQGLPADRLLRRIRSTLRCLNQFLAGMPVLLIGMGYCLALMDVCRRWFGEDGQAIANRLLAGLGGLADAEAGLQLWRLAAMAHEQDGVAAAIRGERHFEAARERIAAAPGGQAFLDAWSRFLRDHGHHTRGEIELGNPRWAEMPDYVLGLLRSYLSGLGRVDPVARARKLARQRRALAAECERRLRSPIKRLVFQALLRRAQQGLRFRETSKSIAVRWLAILRGILLELGDRLVQQGALARSDDVFFLELDELQPVVAGHTGFRPREVVARRRREHDRWAAVDPPPVVFGQLDPEDWTGPAVDERAEVFRGFAVSPGVVRGKARVITHAGDGHVLPGEILVAPITDPGWTPYFLNAAAVVMDQGGLLSHGSIVAREYGLPCVANVGPASQVLRTGQMLEVDGSRGVVRVLH